MAELDAPGVYDLPEAEYHADPLRHLGGSLSSTVARKLLPPSCPRLARYAMDNPEHKDYYDLGSVTHRLTLGAGCPIVEVPAKDWTAAGKEGRRIRDEAREQGAVALLTRDLARAQAMAAAVHDEPLAHAILTAPGAPEQTLVWLEDVDGEPVWCRAMLDRYPDPHNAAPVVGDLKTTSKNLDDATLARTVWDLGYHQQEDWYRRGYRAVHGVDPEFAFIFVHADPPYLCRVFPLDDRFRELGREANDAALRVWTTCLKSGEWPGHPNPFDPIGPPPWARSRGDDW